MTEVQQQPHERINFNLRPAKRIERKLVAEALSCIYRYDTPRRFGYVGMGSYYFSDFVLFHRLFGLEKMISIESDIDHKSRFEFNKPFDCIEMAWGMSTDCLPKLPVLMERPVICWLDYYDFLTDSIIGDVKTVLRRALPGSAVLVTLKAKALGVQKLKDFKNKLSQDNRNLSNSDLLSKGPSGMAQFMSEILTNAIDPTILALNGGRKNSEKIELRQIVKLMYQDGDPMITMGWLILNPGQAAKLDEHPSALDAPGIALSHQGLSEIRAPVLTFREITHLKSMLPNGHVTKDFKEKTAHLPIDDANLFASYYRYFPSFADVEE